ncbi:MAG: choice-of-anchor D domain-containing protein [Myxococcaceae bacterium]
MRGAPFVFATAFAALVLTACPGCDGGNLQQVKPRLSPPGSPVDFGTIPVLNKNEVEIPLTNVGRAKMTVSNVAVQKTDGIFTVKSAPDIIEGGETRPIVVVFQPTAEASYSDTLVFDTDDDENAHLELSLVGVGSTRAIIGVMPAMLDFGRVAECASSVQLLSIQSKGTADLVVEDIAFTDDTNPAFTFVGSTRTPATVKTTDMNGLPGEIQLTIRVAAPAGSTGQLTGGVRIRSTDPDQREIVVPLKATVNQAPIASIGMLGNGAPGQRVTLDGTLSSDPDNDVPLTYKWTLRSKPLASNTVISMADQPTTDMTLDPMVPGQYEVQLDVTDSQGAKSCMPARATVVASPAQKLLVEMFWDNQVTDLDLHVLNNTQSVLFTAPDDCYYQNRTPDWGLMGPMDDPELVRDALTGYGPEVFGYVNPIDTTYRILSVFENEHLATNPSSKVTVRVYLFGVLKAEVSRTLGHAGAIWEVADVTWPSGDVTVLP